jgi:protein-L-isoaspartate(D-aspartate) O-methyltransferase
MWDRVPVTDTARTRKLRQALTEQLAGEFQPSGPVLAAIGRIPRHAFIPDIDIATAYVDDAVITRRDAEGQSVSSISQPSMVAQMLDMLDLRPGLRVLEIGAGTGYCAALIAEVVGPSGAVTTIDVDPDITDEAARNLDASGYSRVTVTCADGALGDPDGAPWDRILVSVGAWEPSPEWIAQLAPDGKIVMPLAIRKIQRIVTFEPAAHGLRSSEVLAGGFLSQRGRDAQPRATLRIDTEALLETENDLGVDAGTTRELLKSEPVAIWTGVELPYPGRFDRLIVYLALHHPQLFTVTAPRTFLPDALRAWNVVYGVAHDHALAHLALRAIDPADPQSSNEVGVVAFGPAAAALAERLTADVRAWGRMPEADPVFEVYPKDAGIGSDGADGIVLDKRHSRIRVTWPEVTVPAVVEMRLLPAYFDLVALGKKTIEVRANDRKRAALQAGSVIRFVCGEQAVEAEAVEVRRYPSFEALYATEDAARINPGRSAADQLAGIGELYGADKRALGAVAIELRLIEGAVGRQ